MKLRVRLNGTDKNPFHMYGLKQNPFPQIAKYEYVAHIMHLQKLGADPIPNVEYIRKHLEGWKPEFVELCVKNFVPGKMVEFTYEN